MICLLTNLQYVLNRARAIISQVSISFPRYFLLSSGEKSFFFGLLSLNYLSVYTCLAIWEYLALHQTMRNYCIVQFCHGGGGVVRNQMRDSQAGGDDETQKYLINKPVQAT